MAILDNKLGYNVLDLLKNNSFNTEEFYIKVVVIEV